MISDSPENSWWHAPTVPANYRLTSRISLPGSKSLTARWMILAATGSEPVELYGALKSQDTFVMAEALTTLGAQVKWNAHSCIIYPLPRTESGHIRIRGNISIHAHQAGTVMRFILPLAAMATGKVTIECATNARHRPISGLVRALTDLGVTITSPSTTGVNFPLTIEAHGPITGGRLTLDSGASSQFLSALLLSAPLMENGLVIDLSPQQLPSAPHVAMTVDVMRQAGHTVVVDNNSWSVLPTKPNPRPIGDLKTASAAQPPSAQRKSVHTGYGQRIDIEPDLSNAGPFLGAAMVTGGEITIENWPQNSTQPGRAYLELLRMAGGKLHVQPTAAGSKLICHGPQTIKPLDVDMGDVGELVPTIAAICAFAPGRSFLRNIGHLRGHETDRLEALTATLNRVGVSAYTRGDTLVIDADPRKLHGGDLHSYADHRMATCGAILGLGIAGVRVDNIEATAKTFPQFATMWQTMITNG